MRAVEDLSPSQASSASMLPEALLGALAALGHTRTYAKGTIVVTEGEPALSMYLIHEGTLRVFVSDEDGKEVELNTMGPGEYFGELMLGSQVRTATVQTTSKAKLTMITRAEFEQALAAQPTLAFHVIQHLIDRVRQLAEQPRDEDGLRVVPGPLSQQKIADRVGASRSMITRILQDLTAGGYIEASREQIVLRKPLPKRW